MKKLLSEIWLRLKSETPSLFKKIRNFGATMTATGTGLAMNGMWKEGGVMAGIGLAVTFCGIPCYNGFNWRCQKQSHQ